MEKQVIKDLDTQLKHFQDEFRNLKEDSLFCAWFVNAYILEDRRLAVESVTGEKGDKNADAVVIDHDTLTVSIVQTKYRKKLEGTNEKVNELKAFALLSRHLYEDTEAEFAKFLKGAAPTVIDKLTQAKKVLSQDGWTLNLLFVTMGKASQGAIDEARATAKKGSPHTQFEFIDGRRLVLLLRDYLDGAAPPVASIELPLESGNGINVRNAMNRHDQGTDISTLVFPVRGSELPPFPGQWQMFVKGIRC